MTISDETARRERIKWWSDGKYGMFIHWGLYTIPAGEWKGTKRDKGYSEWLMFKEKIPVAQYSALADSFNPTSFDAATWVDLAKKAGMTYVVLTTKHHDGFSMFDSDLTDYTVVKATPWKRDPTRELADACREAGIKFCCYYSTDRDWYRKTGQGNSYNQTNTWDYPESTAQDFDNYIESFVKPQISELLTKYQPDLIWFDEIDMKSDEQVQEIYDMIREMKPDCIINSRLKGFTFPKVIPPSNCDYISSGDNEIFDNDLNFEWENPASMNTSFGYNQFDHNWVEPKEIIARLMNIVSRRGNYLLNVGPTADGVIPQPSVDNLIRVGEWLKINGEAVYGTSPWQVAKETNDSGTDARFTEKDGAIYAICLSTTEDEVLIESLGKDSLGSTVISSVNLVGSDAQLSWTQSRSALTISFDSNKVPDNLAVVFKITT